MRSHSSFSGICIPDLECFEYRSTLRQGFNSSTRVCDRHASISIDILLNICKYLLEFVIFTRLDEDWVKLCSKLGQGCKIFLIAALSHLGFVLSAQFLHLA